MEHGIYKHQSLAAAYFYPAAGVILVRMALGDLRGKLVPCQLVVESRAGLGIERDGGIEDVSLRITGHCEGEELKSVKRGIAVGIISADHPKIYRRREDS